MIHEFIDHKKKAKTSRTNSGKTPRDSIETCSAEQSSSEWPSTTLVPPWLRNNLGLKLKNNQNLDWSVCLPNFTALVYGAFDNRTEKLFAESKNENQCEESEGEEMKSTIQEDDPKKFSYFESLPKDYEEEELIQTSESFRKLPSPEKQNREESNSVGQTPVTWRAKPKVAKVESSSTDSAISPPSSRRKNFKMTETNTRAAMDVHQVKNEEKKKQKILKKRLKIKHRMTTGPTSMLEGIDVDTLLEEKANDILQNYGKKKIHSAASDIKRLEAKLILLHTKMSLGKLTSDDMRLLHEIKAQVGSKENFDKLIRHVREVNLKEILQTQNCALRYEQTNKDAEYTNTQPKEELRTLASTDDENDIKRFSELLRKNQNEEEKKKCLEEVRNYFERKRRTRLTKCWTLNAHSKENSIEEGECLKNDKTSMKKTFSDRSAAAWRSKFKLNDAEVVRKAVDETLQKFVELYNFHVSPSLMNSMKNNVLKGIQCSTYEGESLLTRHGDVPYNVEGDKLSTNVQESIMGEESSSKDLKTKHLRKMTLSGSQLIKTEGVALENDQMKRLKNELEYYINSASEDVTRLKVRSVILEEETQDSTGINMKFIYSFTNKCLEQKKSESKVMTKSSLRDMEVQVGEDLSMKNANTQTQKLVTAYEKYIQTEKNSQKSIVVQTEGTCAIELKKLNESDVSTGLYRMVRSKQAGRFYLYPENDEESNNPLKVSKQNKKSDTFKEGKFGKREHSGTFELAEPDQKERGIGISDVFIVDEIKSKKEAGVSSMPEKKQEYIWLWDGEKISSGADLKAQVESLLKEKLKEMSCVFQDGGKDMANQNFEKTYRTGSQENLEFKVLHSRYPLRKEEVGLRLKDRVQNIGEETAGTQSFREPVNPTSEEKWVKDASTQNSEQAFLTLNVKRGKSTGSTHQPVKTVNSMKKRKIKFKRDLQLRRSITDLKKTMQLMNECLSKKKMQLDEERSGITCDSGTTFESNTSSYSKDTSDEHLTLVFGLKNNPGCKNKKNRRMVNELVQTINENNLAESQGSNPAMEKHVHWGLIERVLHKVSGKERENLWNDVRELIKSKIGKDIDNEGANEVCIEIEHDVHGISEGKPEHSVLAKGYYARNEGDVEVEIDLTLNDLERIIRRRERNWRRRSLQYRRHSRSLRSSSSGQSRSNFGSIQQFRNILRTVSMSRSRQLPGDITITKMNKEN